MNVIDVDTNNDGNLIENNSTENKSSDDDRQIRNFKFGDLLNESLESSKANPSGNGKTPLTNSSSERKKKSNNEKLPAAWGRTKMKMLHNKNSNDHQTTLNLGGSAHVVHMSTIIKDKKEYMDGKTKREVEMHQMF